MDPKIGWYQNELMICKAYETWNNIILSAQINSYQQQNQQVPQTISKTTTDISGGRGDSDSQLKAIESSSSSLNNMTHNNDYDKHLNASVMSNDQALLKNESNKESQNMHSKSVPNIGKMTHNNENSLSTSSLNLPKPKGGNKASTFGYSFLSNDGYLNDPQSTPWKPVDFKYKTGYEGLHKEIQLFNDYISATFEECLMRNEIVCKLYKIIIKELPTATLDLFGSYKTGLFLPTSDIDLAVFGEWTTLPLNRLKEAIIREKICDFDGIKVLDKASVPIIKIVESKTDLKVDISFNVSNGIKSVDLINTYISQYPCLKPLFMVVKQFLLQCDYNEVWTGGVGSYSLILMTVSFLQMNPRIDPHSANQNLGLLLIEFFELYGKNFNYIKTAIRVKEGGSYVAKDDIRKQFSCGHASILCIEDPLNATNDIGKGSYGVLKVKQAFEYAYYTLSHAVLPQNRGLLKGCPTILGRIIRVTKEVIDYRRWIKDTYRDRTKEISKNFKQTCFTNNSNLDKWILREPDFLDLNKVQKNQKSQFFVQQQNHFHQQQYLQNTQQQVYQRILHQYPLHKAHSQPYQLVYLQQQAPPTSSLPKKQKFNQQQQRQPSNSHPTNNATMPLKLNDLKNLFENDLHNTKSKCESNTIINNLSNIENNENFNKFTLKTNCFLLNEQEKEKDVNKDCEKFSSISTDSLFLRDTNTNTTTNNTSSSSSNITNNTNNTSTRSTTTTTTSIYDFYKEIVNKKNIEFRNNFDNNEYIIKLQEQRMYFKLLNSFKRIKSIHKQTSIKKLNENKFHSNYPNNSTTPVLVPPQKLSHDSITSNKLTVINKICINSHTFNNIKKLLKSYRPKTNQNNNNSDPTDNRVYISESFLLSHIRSLVSHKCLLNETVFYKCNHCSWWSCYFKRMFEDYLRKNQNGKQLLSLSSQLQDVSVHMSIK